MARNRKTGAPTALDRQALELLRRYGFRCTPGRIAILQVLLASAAGHLTLAEIHQRITELGWPIDNTAVHRSLHTFTDCGLTHALAIPGPPAYGLAIPPHHHALCDTCGGVTNVPAAILAATLAAAQAATGYALTPASLTLPGRCPACQQAPPEARRHLASQETPPDTAHRDDSLSRSRGE